MNGRIEVAIIGGGLAGAAAAASLAASGRQVVVIEREQGPHDKVCGEFLSEEGLRHLDALLVDPVRLGAVPIGAVRLISGNRKAEAPLPFRAMSVSRRALDEAVLRRAAECGAELRRGRRAVELISAEGGWRVRLDDGAAIQADTVFLATGKHDLKNWRRPAGLQHDLIAFKRHFRLTQAQAEPLGNHVELTLFRGGYAGLEPIEDGLANLCLVVRRRRFAAVGQNWDLLLSSLLAEAPHLAQRLSDAAPVGDRALAVATIPYGHIGWRSDGPWRLGDQAAVIPSFAGDGMSIALHSARLAASCLLGGKEAAFYQRRFARDVARSVWLATALSQLMVRPVGQAALMGAARVLPRTMAGLAGVTRLSEGALRRAGLPDLV